jgi:hypothetical protein
MVLPMTCVEHCRPPAPGFHIPRRRLKLYLSLSTLKDQLMTQATNQPKFPVFPESRTKFFLKVVDAQVEFFTDDKGRVSHMILHQNGRDIEGVKK